VKLSLSAEDGVKRTKAPLMEEAAVPVPCDTSVMERLLVTTVPSLRIRPSLARSVVVGILIRELSAGLVVESFPAASPATK